jgi:hypothetical protein
LSVLEENKALKEDHDVKREVANLKRNKTCVECLKQRIAIPALAGDFS